MNVEEIRPTERRDYRDRAPLEPERQCTPSDEPLDDWADEEPLPFPVSQPPAPWPRVFPGL
jgi:hypothetical protein